MTDRPRPEVQIIPIDAGNWRDVARLEVTPAQGEFVASPTYYLCLCHYGSTWHPFAVTHGGDIVGFLMWAVDPADGSTWLGGLIIDAEQQRRGLGAATVSAAIAHLHAVHGANAFALSYNPANEGARRLYAKLGFVETGEQEDDEVVARFELVS